MVLSSTEILETVFICDRVYVQGGLCSLAEVAMCGLL